MRSGSVTDRLSLGIVRLKGACGVLMPVLERCLLNIAGVSQVYVDLPRHTIQILYDGDEQTAQRVVQFLEVFEWLQAERRR